MCNKTENTLKVLQEFYNWLFNYQTNQKNPHKNKDVKDTPICNALLKVDGKSYEVGVIVSGDRTSLSIMDTKNILKDSSIPTTSFNSEVNYTFDCSTGLKFTTDKKEITITKLLSDSQINQ